MIAVLRAPLAAGAAGRGPARAVAGLVRDARRATRIRGGHPWIYRTDVARPRRRLADAEAVTVLAADGRLLGRGFYNPRPSIVCRLVTRRDEPVDDAFFRRRLERGAPSAGPGLRR